MKRAFRRRGADGAIVLPALRFCWRERNNRVSVWRFPSRRFNEGIILWRLP
jgi:hypothetical protein